MWRPTCGEGQGNSLQSALPIHCGQERTCGWVFPMHPSSQGFVGALWGGCREGTSEPEAAIAILAPGAERVEREGKAEERDIERKRK